MPRSVVDYLDRPERRTILQRLDVADLRADADFDRLTALAAGIMATPVALVTLVDDTRQWFRAGVGTDLRETPVEQSLCAHAIAAGDELLVVEDAAADARFAGNPLVSGDMHLRFYAGAPITVSGERIGTLCVIDREPRQRPAAAQLGQLASLAALASSLFALKDATRSGALARAALAREEKRRAIAVEAASLASWVWDVRSGMVECDAALPALFKLKPATRLRARDFFTAIDRRDVREGERFRDAFSLSDDYFGEYRVRDAVPTCWLAARGRVVERDDAGKPLLVFGVNYDITARKSAEENQRLMLRELNHRVKNTLATVQALASQTVRHAADPRQFLDAFSARLHALGLAHSLLSENEWRGIRLQALVDLEVRPYDNAAAPRIAISGDDLLLSPDQALGLGMILHELASNALKYGALSAPSGKVELAWRTRRENGRPVIRLDWQERGGPAVSEPQRQGFGSILIGRSLSKVIDSRVSHEFLPEGVRAEVVMPLDQV